VLCENFLIIVYVEMFSGKTQLFSARVINQNILKPKITSITRTMQLEPMVATNVEMNLVTIEQRLLVVTKQKINSFVQK